MTLIPPDIIAVATGEAHSVMLRSSGVVFALGENDNGETNVPSSIGQPAVGTPRVAAIEAGVNHSLALRVDGTVIGWGHSLLGAITIPSGLANVRAISAGEYITPPSAPPSRATSCLSPCLL